MSRQALGQALRTIVRRAGLGVVLGIAGAFAVTLLSWAVSSMAASADETAPLVNVVGTGDPLGLVNDTVQDTVQDTVHGTVEAVTTKVLPARTRGTQAKPLVVDTLDRPLQHAMKTVGSLVSQPKHRAIGHVAPNRAAAPVIVPSPPPEKHVITPPVRRPPVPMQSVALRQHAVAPVDQPTPARHSQPEGPVSPAPSPEWGVPSAPVPNGSAGTTFHSPDTPVLESGMSRFRAERTEYRPLRSTGLVVFRTVNAQPGVTPD